MASYGYSGMFKKEFISVIQDAIKITQKKLRKYPNDANMQKARGFEGIRLSNTTQ